MDKQPPTTFIEPTEPDAVNINVPVSSDDVIINKNEGKAPPSRPSSNEMNTRRYIHSFASVFEDMPISELKMLAEALEKKIEPAEFEGLLGALIINNKNSDDLLDKVEKIKDHLDILHGILKGIITKKEYLLSKLTPKPSVVIAEQNQGDPKQDSVPLKGQPLPPKKLDEKVEMLIDEQLLKAIKDMPLDDVKRIGELLTTEVDPSTLYNVLKKLQSGIPSLTDPLIQVAALYPSDLKAAIEEYISENGFKSTLTPAPNVQTAVNQSVTSINKPEPKIVENKNQTVQSKGKKTPEATSNENEVCIECSLVSSTCVCVHVMW